MFGRYQPLRQAYRDALAWLNIRLQRALPGYCAFCHAPVADGTPWCMSCYAEMPWNRHACRRCAEPLASARIEPLECGRCLRHPSALTRAWVPLRYEGRVMNLVQRYKFSADPRAGEVLIRLLLASLDDPSCLGDVVIGVPGQRDRTRERGFDHTAWLTTRLADRLHLPVVSAQRLRETPSQRDLDRVSRRRNVKRAFAVPQRLPPSVTVADDVMTTGATLESLAEACRVAGAERITALAFARTPSDRI